MSVVTNTEAVEVRKSTAVRWPSPASHLKTKMTKIDTSPPAGRTRFDSQQSMRFGPRFYTVHEASIIANAVADRTDLAEAPFPFDD